MGGVTLAGGVWHLRGTPGHPGRIVSRDVVMTMDLLDWTEKTRTGVATGSPQIEDPQNTITAIKMSVEDPPARDQRRAIFQDRVKIVHRPEKGSDEADNDDLSDVFTHDVVLTCDHAEYFYRLKTGFATGHILLSGEHQEDGKPINVTLTSDRLEYEDHDNIYRAIGHVIIHDGDQVITTPRLVAVAIEDNGKRKLETVSMDNPTEFSGTVKDDSEDSGASGTQSGTTPATPATPAPTAPAPATPAHSPTAPAPTPSPPAAPQGKST